MFTPLGSSFEGFGFKSNPQPHKFACGQAQIVPNTGFHVVPVNTRKGVKWKMSEGDGVQNGGYRGDRHLAAEIADQLDGGMKDGPAGSGREEVGHRSAIFCTGKQGSFVSDKYYSELDINQTYLRPKLTTIFLELLDNKHDIRFRFAVHER